MWPLWTQWAGEIPESSLTASRGHTEALTEIYVYHPPDGSFEFWITQTPFGTWRISRAIPAALC